jgi:leader peptidase (prepilin peptidase)/N-methyltransferase
MSPLTASVLAGLLGLAFGSFANVVIHRVPQGRSVVRPGSSCPTCGAPVAPRDNLPLVGWLLLGGRCRSCRAPIPVSYPLVELAMGVLWFLLTYRLVAVGLRWAVPAYLALALVSPRGMGLGDVKLAPTLGLALGWLSWGAVAFGVFASFLLGGLAGLAAIGLLGLNRKSLLPFGPWLVTGALLGVLAGADVAAWYAGTLTGS